MRPSRLLLLSLLACLGLAVGTTALAQGPATIPLPGGGKLKVKLPGKGKAKKRSFSVQLGISEQKADMFTDPRFRALGMNIARRSIGWDTFEYDWQIQDIDNWLRQAQAAGVRPLITFARSRIHSKVHMVPTRAQWRAGFREFRRRYPWVKDFVASNESNHTPPTAKNPRIAAHYYNDMRKACRSCRVAAATINEQPDKKHMEDWIKKFVKAAGHRPKYWALHNYYGANKFTLAYTKRMLKATKSGQVWVTEVGGLVIRRTADFKGKLKMPEGLAHATRAYRFILDKMTKVSPRVTRIYLFHWNASGPQDTWDSALVGPDGEARGSLTILQDRLKRTR